MPKPAKPKQKGNKITHEPTNMNLGTQKSMFKNTYGYTITIYSQLLQREKCERETTKAKPTYRYQKTML